MSQLLWLILGYVIHDAVQPTVVGEVLDKVALPADLFTSSTETKNAEDAM